MPLAYVGSKLVSDGIMTDEVKNYLSFVKARIDNQDSSDNEFDNYILGINASYQSVLLKVDPNGHTNTNLLTTGDYDIYNVVVDSSDELQFYALRMSDGERVLAEIDNTGNITIISVLNGNTVTVLERIN